MAVKNQSSGIDTIPKAKRNNQHSLHTSCARLLRFTALHRLVAQWVFFTRQLTSNVITFLSSLVSSSLFLCLDVWAHYTNEDNAASLRNYCLGLQISSSAGGLPPIDSHCRDAHWPIIARIAGAAIRDSYHRAINTDSPCRHLFI